MRNLAKIFTGVLLLFFLFNTPSTAEITSVKIRSDNRHVILFQKFGFTPNGHVSVAISSVSVTSVPVTSNLSRPDPSRLGFFLLSEEAQADFQHERNLCKLDSKFISLLFTFRELSPPSQSSINKSHHVTFPSEYSLYFANCNPLSFVTMDVRTELYNTDNGANYLSVGLTHLPALYFIMALIYVCFLGFWIFVSFMNKPSFQKIHLLIGVLLVMKALNLFCAVKVQHYVKVTGTPPYGWDVMFYIFHLIKAVVLYTVMAMIGDGWSFLKPFLQEKGNKKVLMIVIPIQVLATVVTMVIRETGPFIRGWVTLNMVLFLIECICCVVIIVPIGWWICSFRETCETDHDVKAARKYLVKLYIVVIGYFFIGWCLAFGVVGSIVAYKYRWVSIASVEITGLAFYMVMFCMFSPFEKDQHFVQLNLEEPVPVQEEEFKEPVAVQEEELEEPVAVQEEEFELV